MGRNDQISLHTTYVCNKSEIKILSEKIAIQKLDFEIVFKTQLINLF